MHTRFPSPSSRQASFDRTMHWLSVVTVAGFALAFVGLATISWLPAARWIVYLCGGIGMTAMSVVLPLSISHALAVVAHDLTKNKKP